MSTKNPFLPTFGTSPPLLAGRNREVERFAHAFEEGPRHPDYTMLITGAMGTGKTVLLNEAEDAALSRGWRVVSVSASVTDLTARITAAVLEHLRELEDGKPARRISSVQAFGVGIAWEDRPDEGYGLPIDLRAALTALAQRLTDTRTGLLLTVDEMQGVHLSDARELAVAVQHVTRRELLPVAFAGAALPEIDSTVLNDREMTFFQRCARSQIGPLQDADTELALHWPITNAGKAIHYEALRVMVEASRGHPYSIQLLGYHGWETAFADPAAPGTLQIEVKHAQAGTLEAERAELEQIVKPIWSGLSEVDRSFLVAMAHDEQESSIRDIARRLGKSTNYVQHYKCRLVNAGAISPASRGKIRFVHNGTRSWLSNLGFDIRD